MYVILPGGEKLTYQTVSKCFHMRVLVTVLIMYVKVLRVHKGVQGKVR